MSLQSPPGEKVFFFNNWIQLKKLFSESFSTGRNLTWPIRIIGVQRGGTGPRCYDAKVSSFFFGLFLSTPDEPWQFTYTKDRWKVHPVALQVFLWNTSPFFFAKSKRFVRFHLRSEVCFRRFGTCLQNRERVKEHCFKNLSCWESVQQTIANLQPLKKQDTTPPPLQWFLLFGCALENDCWFVCQFSGGSVSSGYSDFETCQEGIKWGDVWQLGALLARVNSYWRAFLANNWAFSLEIWVPFHFFCHRVRVCFRAIFSSFHYSTVCLRDQSKHSVAMGGMQSSLSRECCGNFAWSKGWHEGNIFFKNVLIHYSRVCKFLKCSMVCVVL